MVLVSRAVDPDSLNPDPDTDPDPDPIRIQSFDDQKPKKQNTDLIKNCNLLMSWL